MLRYFNEVYAASRALPPDSTAERPAAAAAAPRRLALEVPPAVRAAVTKARASFDAAIASTELATLESDAFSSGLLKQHRVSPDGMLQMSFQLAHYRMHGHSASTYESASTAAFKHGRTETIRSCTPLSHAFAQAFCTEGSTPSERAAKMRAAVANHSRVTRDALTGNGMDRHLFALRKLAEAEGAVPRLFTGAAMAKLNKIILSTSTMQSWGEMQYALSSTSTGFVCLFYIGIIFLGGITINLLLAVITASARPTPAPPAGVPATPARGLTFDFYARARG